MALRIARGLFRLWLVLSVLWVGAVGMATWSYEQAVANWRQSGDAAVGLPAPVPPPGVPDWAAKLTYQEARRLLQGPKGELSYENAVRLDEAFRRSPGGVSREELAVPVFDPSLPSIDLATGKVIPPSLPTSALVAWMRNGARWTFLPPVFVLLVGSRA